MGGKAVAARARRAVPHDHAEALRVEGHEVDQEDRVRGARPERILGDPRLLELRRAVVQRPILHLARTGTKDTKEGNFVWHKT